MNWCLTLILLAALPALSEPTKPVAPAPQPPQAQGPRWRQIQDADGKVLATLDTKDNSMEFLQSCEKQVVPALLAEINRVVVQCNTEINRLVAKPEEKKVTKKK